MRAFCQIIFGLACLPAVTHGQAPAERFALTDPRGGSDLVGLILGKTTLPDVERIFATRGQREALASARLPRRLTPPPRWTVGGVVITPSLRVDETSQSPTLYFDGAQRLVLVVDPAAQGVTLTQQLTLASDCQYQVELSGVRVAETDRLGVAGPGC